MQTLVKASDRLAAKNKKFEITEKKSLDAKASLMRLSAIDDPLTERICEEIRTLWNDKSIKETYKLRGSSYYLGDSAKYFIERFLFDTYANATHEIYNAISGPDIRGKKTTVLHFRTFLDRESEHQEFWKWIMSTKKTHFKVFDVGGQRNGM